KGDAEAKGLLIQKDPIVQQLGPLVFPPEPAATVELGRDAPAIRMEFGSDQGEVGGIVFHQVPGVGGEPVFHLGDKPGRAEEVDTFFASQAEPEQMVEADEMVDVGMGDEDMREPQDLAGREGPDVSQVEEERPPFVKEIDIDRRVVEGAVYQARMELGRHVPCSLMAKSGQVMVN